MPTAFIRGYLAGSPGHWFCEKMVVDDVRALHVKPYDNSQDKEMTLSCEL